MTRPRPLGDAVSRAIEKRGGTVIPFPVIEISDPDSFVALDDLLHNIQSIELLVFVSAAAVEGFFSRKEQLDIPLPESLKVAAMGPETARSGRDKGLDIDFIPEHRLDSEGLLIAFEGIDLKNRNVVILRGQSGRDLLKSEMEKQGAHVTFVQCYARRTTIKPIQPIIDTWSAGGVDVVLITSVSILDGLFELLGAENVSLLNNTPVVTISERIQNVCLKRGVAHVRVATGISNDCLVDAMSVLAEC